MRLEPDSEQSRVLDHEHGILLVSGPPGSGKTALLRERFARLVESGVDPERVALLALNRRAAREARDHLIRRLERSLPDLPITTIHGFAFRVLGSHFRELGYDSPPQVLSAPEQYAVVRELLASERHADWPRFSHLLKVPGFARQVADFVLRSQERLLDPESLDALVKQSGMDEYHEVAGFYRRYLEALSTAGQVDFATLIFQAVSLLERGSGERFDHVMVDDYQDATHATEGILKVLAGAARSVVIAADPAGHVFSYRGGSLEPLGRIRERLGSVEEVHLSRSYRMGEGAAALAHLDPSGLPSRGATSIEARLFAHPGEEMEAVAHELLRARVDDDLPWESQAVILRRYGEYLTGLRHALARHGIPFVVVAEAAAVATEPANRPVIDLLRYAYRPESREDLLEPVLASPIGGLDPHALRRLRREARKRDVSLMELVERGAEPLPPDLQAAVEQFRGILAELTGAQRTRGPDAIFFWLWSELPWFRELVRSGNGRRDLDALSALGNVLSRFVERRPGSTVEDYLDTLDAAEFGPDPWVLPEERHPHAVRVISAHRAQGVEFQLALIPGCLEGEFPSLSHRFPLIDLDRIVSPMSPSNRLQQRLAEERALFRLAVSRAPRTVLFASESASARNPRTPSRFPARLGVAWSPGDGDGPASTSLRAMETLLRRRVSDPSGPRAERLAALAALPKIHAEPSAWWGRLEWTDPGIPLFEGDIRTSYSRLSVLQNCALQYLYQVELGLDPEETHQMWLGSVVHAVIDRVQRGEVERTEEAVLADLDAHWKSGIFPNRAIEHRRRLDAEAMLRRWLLYEQSAPERSEVWFSFPIKGGEVRGRIDAVFQMANGHLRVVDYKTSRYPMSQEDTKEDLQLAAYYLAVKRDEELSELGEPRMLQLAYLGKEVREGGFARRTLSPRTVENYDAWAQETLENLAARVRAEDFAPSPEADCQWCSFKSICPVWPQGAEVTA
ncbi:MAG TPA: ATP-dependent DNA helicase [Actinomycetota bacterium]|nr:ATP-dependent DNA helicase [Actinomycetota bacterium]